MNTAQDADVMLYLRYWAQMLDELPMVYSSCTFIYSLYMVNSDTQMCGVVYIYAKPGHFIVLFLDTK